MPEVPLQRTPLSYPEIRAVLSAAHQAARGGEVPSRRLLRFAWSHVCLETGGGKSVWNFNLGNMKCYRSDDVFWVDLSPLLKDYPDEPPTQFAYPDAMSGAVAYWSRMYAKWPKALAASQKTDDTDPAVHELKAGGYFQAPESTYARSVRRWAAAYDERWPSGSDAQVPPGVKALALLSLSAATFLVAVEVDAWARRRA